MFQLYESGGQSLILKTNVKRWEYKLYGGRPEFYPQDRMALLTMQKFRQERQEHDRKRTLTRQRMVEMQKERAARGA